MIPLRIVLVHPSHTGNIGAVARAMKTMGFSQLYLVAPQQYPDEKSLAMASGAIDVLKKTTIVDTLEAALAPCYLVIGTSSRTRTLDWPILDARQAGNTLAAHGQQGQVAVVFGCERTGLSNAQLQQCHYHLQIPANPDYCSLNLAMAVQIVCYEVRMALLTQQAKTPPLPAYPNHNQLEQFYVHLQQILEKTGFLRLKHPGLVMNKLRRLFNRARPDQEELNILRGILSSVGKLKKQKILD